LNEHQTAKNLFERKIAFFPCPHTKLSCPVRRDVVYRSQLACLTRSKKKRKKPKREERGGEGKRREEKEGKIGYNSLQTH